MMRVDVGHRGGFNAVIISHFPSLSPQKARLTIKKGAVIRLTQCLDVYDHGYCLKTITMT